MIDIINEKELPVSFKVAQLIREIIDGPEYSFSYYDTSGKHVETTISTKLYPNEYHAFTQTNVQEYLRRVHRINVTANTLYSVRTEPSTIAGYTAYLGGISLEEFVHVNQSIIKKTFSTWEEALEFGLEQALIQVKNRNSVTI